MHREVIEKLAYYLQFLLVLTSTLTLSSACPSDCSCKWKGGKQSVECLNRGLRTFPGPIDPGTQVLDLAGNSFETLPPDHFMRLGLINLQKIYLSKCRLSHISPRTFRGLSNLVDLDLSNNVMREVPSGAFPDCQGLMRLILSGNPIPHLQRNVFISLESLTTLEISYAGIELIEKGAFDGLVSLEWLKLNGNKLKRISGLGSLPLGLKGIWLEENQWDCDCRLLELRLWLGERNVANSIEPRCLTPAHLTNSTIKDLAIDNFACLPQLSPTTMYQKIGEGKNVSLLCKVVSVPESTLEWWFNGVPVLNSSLNIFVETSSSNSGLSTLPLTSSSLPWLSQLNNHITYNNNNNNNHVNNHNHNPHGYVSGSDSGSNLNNNNNNNYQMSSMGNNNNNNNNVGIERKSELLILNATSDENGTFVCVARNPAGVATANFTLKVLTRQDLDSIVENTVTSLVASYPNILVVMVSTGGVIGVVILLLILIFVICKCSQLCRQSGRRRRRSSESPHSDQRLKDNSSSRGRKEGKETTGCGGKLNRHLSEASTLTTATKSNGSVFLLSTSSELGIGDSNPDLIEGVKRVEGDGHETSFTASSNNFNSSSVYASPESTANPISLDPFPPSAAYPIDYGLPKNLNVTTLVRRSPSTYASSNNPPQLSIPPNYDLAKYPKEYISPTPIIQCGQHLYAGPPAQGLMYGPPPSAEYYPAYMVAPDGTFLYSGGHNDYYMGMDMGGMGGYGPPMSISSGAGVGNTVVITSGANCTCAPIIEQSEEEKAAMEAETESMMSSGTGDTMTATSMSHQGSNSNHRSGSNGMEDGNSGCGGGGDTSTMKRRGESGMVARLQRQLKSQINESPDEGYEDESAEGTEI